jgi:hypothetical protein
MTVSLRLSAALALASIAATAQAAPEAPAAAKPAKPLIAVSAPNAQALVKALGTRHTDIALLGLHATIPGSQDNVIIACTDAPRIGKPSSPGDMALIGKTKIVVARLDAKNVYEVALPVSDAQGRSVGMMVDQMPIAQISGEVDALNRALALRAELQKGIQSEAWLFAGQ